MEQTEIIRRLVLNEICDDYENVDQTILADVSSDGARLGLTVNRADIVNALASLVADGFAGAYLLYPQPTKRLEHMPVLDVPEEFFATYFLATDKGKALDKLDNSWWPFED